MKILWCITIVLLAACGNVKSSPGAILSKASFMPENNYHLTKTDSFSTSQITEQQFYDMIEVAENFYSPIFQGFGGNFYIERDWNSKIINAYAEKIGSTYKVSLFGGLAKHKHMTRDGFLTVICHEIGHLKAGWPLYSSAGWPAANEGNSDYYATSACAKALLPLLDGPVDEDCTCPDGDESCVPKTFAPAQASACSGATDRSLCLRLMDAGQSLGNVLAELGNEPMPSYDNLDRTVVSKTQESHPKASCRLTTYYYGTLCEKQWNEYMIPKNKKEMLQISCNTRPKCWYAP